MAKKLSSKANYVSKRNIKSITVQRGKKTTEIASKDLIDGAYVKKGVKFGKGGNSNDKYVVNVGNIGNITCETMAEAEKTYKEYVSQSKSGKGRASGEDVILMVDGEPMEEYFGTNGDEYAKGGSMKNKPKDTKRPRPNIRKNPKIVRTQFEEEEFEYGKGGNTNELKAKKRLEELRKELRAERISYSELVELQSLAKYIDKNDVELLEAAGVDEFRKGGVMGDIYSIQNAEQFKQLITTYNELYEKFGVVNYFLDYNDNSVVFLMQGDEEYMNNSFKLQKYVDSLYNRGFDVFDKTKNKNIMIHIDNSQGGGYVYFKLKLSEIVRYSNGGDVSVYNDENDLLQDAFRKGGVAGSKHVDVTKGYRLPHGYKAVKGEDRNRNYSKGKPKVKVTTGWRLPKGYEVVDGAYNMKYEDGGMMAEKRVRIIKDVNFDGYFKIVDASSNRIVLEDNIRGVKNAITIAEDKGYDIVSVDRYEDGGMMGGNMNDCYCYEIGGL
jgi:hypothetical protein